MEKTQYRESCRLDTYRVDRNEIGKPSGLWQLMQEAASNQMEAQKPSYTDLVDAGQALMLARVDLAIPEQIGLKEALVSSSWPCPSTRATFLRNYSLMRGSETVAFAATQWTLVDLASRKILKIDAVDFGNYWMGDYQELIHEKFRIDKETLTAMQTVGQKEVRYSDLDYNGHMNNTYYLDVLCDYVPELAAAVAGGSVITSEMEAFFAVCPAKLIAVTGRSCAAMRSCCARQMRRSTAFRQTVNISSAPSRQMGK